MICAYNLCFSTIMGKLSTGREERGRETSGLFDMPGPISTFSNQYATNIGRLGASTYSEDATVDGLRRHAYCVTDVHTSSATIDCNSDEHYSAAASGEVDSFISPNGKLVLYLVAQGKLLVF